jgi:predicted enzyme related to lactoylglutathione lyase
MSTRTVPWSPGTPNWADLATSDLAASTAFYGAVLGWEVADLGADFGHYGIASRKGLATAGIGPAMSPDQPNVWTTYLSVEDADKTAETITTNGGTVLLAPMDVGDQGRMAVAVDPTGAVFGIWQAGAMIGTQLVNEAGGVCWNDHTSADPEAARRFYTAVFGYAYTALEGAHDYSTIDGAGPGNTVGGIGAFPPGAPEGTPAHWTVYFAVDDADAAAATAAEHGGSVVVPAVDTPFGRQALLRGPEGAVFTVLGISPEFAAQL